MRASPQTTAAEQLRVFRAAYAYQHHLIDGVRWEYIAAGAGDQALLLLPGAPGRGETSFQYILAFAPHFRVIAPSYPAEVVTADALVRGLVGLLRAERIPCTHVLGGSYSGMIAQCLLRRHPDLIDRLVLSDTGIPSPRRARQTRWLLRSLDMLPYGIVRALLKLGTYAFVRPMGADRGFWRAYFHALLDELGRDDMRARLAVGIDIDANERFAPWSSPRWHGAILVLDAAGDAVFGAAEQARLRALYPNARSQTTGDHGHAGSLATAEVSIAAIGAFLNEPAGVSA